ncbi:MAG: hypothetical protein GF334_02935 [Candidatus Altiarchaeales archaeon]|nr:hypothetical protein [Candidatus Altiarchaeales archaeon]
MTPNKTNKAPRSRRVGGVARAKIARKALTVIFRDETDPLYYAKDMDFARQFFVSRHTIQKIREELGVPSRSQRILDRLDKMDLSEFTIKELSSILSVKYQNLYKIITENGLQVKADRRPVESLKEYQKNRKKSVPEN